LNRRLVFVSFFGLAAIVGGYVALCGIVLRPMPKALDAMASDALVTVEAEPWPTFRPTGAEPAEGFIFYPGARADPQAYAPAARAIAAEGYVVVIVPMPFNLAIFCPNAAAEVMEAYPGVERWAVGGHSLGGAMAVKFVHDHPGAVDGVILWAPFYLLENGDLADRDLDVMTVYGTRDGLVSQESIDGSRSRLPADARWVAVEGGNHAQFAWYGSQTSDNPATITREAQQQEIVTATLDLLAVLKE
jgi:dienelactone hydrolase